MHAYSKSGGATPTPGVAYIGYNTAGSTNDTNGTAGDMAAYSLPASSSFTATQMHLYLHSAATGKVKCAIYSDSSGNPGSLLASTSELTNPGSGWQTFTGISQSITSGTAYWLVFWMNSIDSWNCESSGGTMSYKNTGYGTWPSSFGTPSGSTTEEASIYADGSGGSSTPTPTPAGGTLGCTSVGSSNNSSSANDLNAFRFQAGSSFTATQMKLYLASAVSGKMKLAIYSDSSGSVGSMLKGTNELTNPASGWVTFTLTASQAITSGSYYWLVEWANASYTTKTDTTKGTTKYGNVTYSTTWPAGSSINNGPYTYNDSIYTQ